MYKGFYIITFILLAIGSVKSQSCQGFHLNQKCSVPEIDGFKRFGQSRSKLVEAKKTFTYNVVLFGGYDYKVGFCTNSDYEPIHYKIINADDNSVFYDNSNDDYVENVGFTVEKTKNVIFEITILATDKEFRDYTDYRTCAGIAIFWRRVPKTGF